MRMGDKMGFVKLESFCVGVDDDLASVRLIFITTSSKHLAEAIKVLESAKLALDSGKGYQSGVDDA